MKNSPIAQPQPSPAWREALALLDADLRRRGSAQRTCDAYATDQLQLARWGTAQGIEPAAMDLRALRRNAAHLSDVGNGPATVARKLAAARALFRVLREHGVIEQNPGDLVPGPKRPSKLPRVLDREEVTPLLDRIPASTPLELRDRALFELAYASGLRAEELVRLAVGSVDFDAEEARVEGKGSKTRVLPTGEAALRTLADYGERGRPPPAAPPAGPPPPPTAPLPP